jgi:hypothetical protein
MKPSPDKENEQGRQYTDKKQRSPGVVPRHDLEKQRRHQSRDSPTYGPGTLHSTNCFSAMLAPDCLRSQDRTSCPFAAKTQAL